MGRFFSLLGALALSVLAYGQTGLRDVVGRDMLIGVAVNQWQASGKDSVAEAIVSRHFNALVAENCMKPQPVQPKEGVFRFEDGDRLIAMGERCGAAVTGHCLVWHSQVPDRMFVDANGERVGREVLIQRMRTHIHQVVTHFKGKVRGWDVVNEALNDDGTLRTSPWTEIIGPDFIELAFRAAHEADPDAELYYNDYSLSLPAKRDGVCRLVRQLQAHGVRIDAVGMQSHHSLTFPDLKDYEASIDSFAALGVKVMATELDVDVLPSPYGFHGAEVSQSFDYQRRLNPYTDGLPDSVAQQLADRYQALFDLYHRHSHQMSRITLWGISDAASWLNGFPVNGRTNYPLFFDRQYREKPFVQQIIRRWQEAEANRQ